MGTPLLPPRQTPINPGMPMNGSGVVHAVEADGGNGGVGLEGADRANG